MKIARPFLLTTMAALTCGSALATDFGQRTPEVGELVEALTPPQRTRGVAIVGASAAARPKASMQVGFALGSAEVIPGDRVKLDRLAEALKNESLRDHQFEVVGHTDATGPMPLNMRLSKQRADSVVAYLKEQGVDATRLATIGRGPNELLNTQRPDAAENRRVEVRLVK